MSPRVAKKDRGEPPTPMVKSGVVGGYPIKPLGLSYIHSGHADAIIGVKDHPETLQAKEKAQFLFHEGKAKTPADFTGKVFNGFADAFYRGNLPQVVLVVPDAGEIFKFMDEFFDYLEKLYSLGFFIVKKNDPMASPIDPVDQYVPCFVVASNGIFYNSFLKKLADSLYNIKQVDETAHRKIMNKFCRGIMDPCDWQPYEKGQPIQVEPVRRLTIAGGSAMTQNTVQYLLSARGLEVTIETHAENAVERLELQNALRRTILGFLPALSREGQLTPDETECYESKIRETILTIGRECRAFQAEETAERLLPVVGTGKAFSSQIQARVIPGDSSIVNSLIKYAELLKLEEQTQGLQSLKDKVLEQLRLGH